MHTHVLLERLYCADVPFRNYSLAGNDEVASALIRGRPKGKAKRFRHLQIAML